MWQRDKVTGEVVTVPRKEEWSGRTRTPKPIRERVHLKVYDKMRKRKRGGLDAIFIDEVQLFSNRSGRRPPHDHLMRGTELNVAASGTWFGEQIENQWTIARWVWPDDEIVTGSFHRWRERYMTTEAIYTKAGSEVTTRDPRTGQKVPASKTVGERIPGEFTASLPCYLRWENPHRPPAPQVVKLPPTPQQARQLEELNRDMFAWLETLPGDEMPLVVDIPAALQNRLYQVTVAELSFADAEGTEGRDGGRRGIREAERDARHPRAVLGRAAGAHLHALEGRRHPVREAHGAGRRARRRVATAT